MQPSFTPASPWRELLAFLGLCIVVWPVVMTLLIGVYGVGWWIRLLTASPAGSS
ncbi:MAG: hypothetical protein U1E70_06930 [Acetobacteraceae bacterium]